jgi:UTP--glucose-1-phosphate uridylyltransferase
MGAAVSLFDGTAAVMVPRNRFYPVKTCNDLLAVRSDCFAYSADQSLRINPAREAMKKTDVVKVKLDPKYYGKIDGLDERFGNGIPSLVDCDSLTIEGDVLFEKDVKIKGEVKIKNTKQRQTVIKKGTVIDQNLNL